MIGNQQDHNVIYCIIIGLIIGLIIWKIRKDKNNQFERLPNDDDTDDETELEEL